MSTEKIDLLSLTCSETYILVVADIFGGRGEEARTEAS
jgi:hypothetical protein